MSLVRPQRVKGEMNTHWNSRRDAYRLELMESQIAELQSRVKLLEKKRK